MRTKQRRSVGVQVGAAADTLPLQTQSEPRSTPSAGSLRCCSMTHSSRTYFEGVGGWGGLNLTTVHVK